MSSTTKVQPVESPRASESQPAPPIPRKVPFVQRWLTTLTLIGAAVGIIAGTLCNALLHEDSECGDSQPHDVVKVLSFPGLIWVRALKLMVVPMIFTSMVVSVSAVGKVHCAAGSKPAATLATDLLTHASGFVVSQLGSTNTMAALAIKFYLTTTAVAALTGITMFNIFRFSFEPLESRSAANASLVDNCTDLHALERQAAAAATARLSLLDTVLNFGVQLVPDNLVEALYHSKLLGVITVGISFGYMLSISASPHKQAVINLFEACLDTFVAMIKIVILFTPLGVGSLVAGSIATSSRLMQVGLSCARPSHWYRPGPALAPHYHHIVRRTTTALPPHWPRTAAKVDAR